MKNLLSYLPKKTLVFLVSLLAVIGIGAGALATFGPGRQTFTWQSPATFVTFNSITDNPTYGDERSFLTASAPGQAYADPVNTLQDGDEVALRVYYHNDAAANLGLVATNTAVKVALPTGSAKTQQVTAYINADNATPQSVYDTLDLNAANGGFFELEYVPGSARLQNQVFTNGITLSDTIVTTGAIIGYDQMNGNVPGCDQYAGSITLKVKVHMPNYSIEKLARIAGEQGADKWRETVNAKATDTIEWIVEVSNIGTTMLNDFVFVDQVPNNLTVVPGSVKLISNAYPAANPYTFPDTVIQNNGRQINVQVGDYSPNNNFFIRFSTKVTDEKALVCGENRFTNTAYATPQGYGAVYDEAYLVINKDCGQPVYSCNNLNVTKVTGRQIKADVATTANNGASLSTITYSFGDGSTDLVSSNSSVSYTYAKDGTFTVKAVPSFKIGNQTFTANSASCAKSVTFGTPPELPNTGAGSVIGIFAGTTIVSALGYRLWAVRRMTR